MKTKTRKQVQSKADVLCNSKVTNHKHDFTEVIKILKPTMRVRERWTEKQKVRLNKALEKYGKDYSKIAKQFHAKSYTQISSYAM